MGKALSVISTAVITAILTSAFWVLYFGIFRTPGSERKVETAGQKTTIGADGQAPVTIAEGVVVGPAGLAIPVQGIKAKELVDTYTQARAGGARSHDAIDIMAGEGTPVLAAADGVVEKLFFSRGGGGISAYVRSPDERWSYYYAHLQGYAPGLAEGQLVKRGQVLGRVGYTGNANPAGPHLHFAVNRMEPSWKWHQGAPINPYPLLAGKGVRG